MNIITTLISFLIFSLLILSPFLIMRWLKRTNSSDLFFYFLLIGIVSTSLLTLLFAWWSDYANQIMLSSYGYSFDAINDLEKYKNVAPENLENAKGLRQSILGVGWPLKAIMTYIFYTPYLLLIYSFYYFTKTTKSIN